MAAMVTSANTNCCTRCIGMMLGNAKIGFYVLTASGRIELVFWDQESSFEKKYDA